MNCCSPKWLMLGLLDSDLLSAVLGYMSFLFRLWRQKVGAINDDRVVLSILWRCIFFAEAWTNQSSRSFSDQTLLRQTRRFFGKLRVFWVNSQVFPRSKADVLSILNLGVFKNLCRDFWTLHGGWTAEDLNRIKCSPTSFYSSLRPHEVFKNLDSVCFIQSQELKEWN